MNPVIVISLTADNAARAEATLDWCYQLGNRIKRDHILLAFDADCSPEQRERIKLTADLAFLSVQELVVPRIGTAEKPASQVARNNNAFLAAAEFCQKSFRIPWLFLEGDCTPTNPDWLENIAKSYDAQPLRYMGVHLKPTEESVERFLFRIAVYHMGAFNDMVKVCGENPETPFEMSGGKNIAGRSTKCRLFQPLKVLDESDFSKVWPEAQIVCGDLTGALIEHYRELGVHLPGMKFRSETVLDYHPNGVVPIIHVRQPEKVDGRTKAGRAARQQSQQAA